VAREAGVWMACHHYDPPGLPLGYQLALVALPPLSRKIKNRKAAAV